MSARDWRREGFENFMRGRNGSRPMYLFLECTPEDGMNEEIALWWRYQVGTPGGATEAMTYTGHIRMNESRVRLLVKDDCLTIRVR